MQTYNTEYRHNAMAIKNLGGLEKTGGLQPHSPTVSATTDKSIISRDTLDPPLRKSQKTEVLLQSALSSMPFVQQFVSLGVYNIHCVPGRLTRNN